MRLPHSPASTRTAAAAVHTYRRSRAGLGSSGNLGFVLGPIDPAGEGLPFRLGKDGIFKGCVVTDLCVFTLSVEIAIDMNLQLGGKLDLLLGFIAESDGLVAFIKLLLLDGLLS